MATLLSQTSRFRLHVFSYSFLCVPSTSALLQQSTFTSQSKSPPSLTFAGPSVLSPCRQLKSIHAFLRLQEELEALELAYHGEQAPRPGATVLPPNPPSTGMGEGGRHSADLASGAATTAAAEYFPENSDSSCSSSWPLPCVSVDREGNSYFTDKIVKLSAGAASGIGALSELIPAMGETDKTAILS